MKKKDFVIRQPSSVGSEELRDLDPSVESRDRTASNPVLGSEHDDVAIDGESRHETLEDREVSSEGRRGGGDNVVLSDGLPERSRSRVSEGSETRIKGGPDVLPEVKDLVFNEDYKVAAHFRLSGHLLGFVRDKRKVGSRKTLLAAIREKKEAVTREKVLSKEFDEGSASAVAELKLSRESMKNLEQVVDVLGREKAALNRDIAAASIRHTEETDRHQKSRKFECLEQFKESGIEIPQETIGVFAEQEEYFKREATRLEVGEIPEDDLRLLPLVLESRFLVKDVLDKVDPYGSNTDLIDSEAAVALRTPCHNDGSPTSGLSRDLAHTTESPTLCEASRTNREPAPRDQVLSHEGNAEPTALLGGLRATSTDVPMEWAPLPTDPLSGAPSKVLLISNSPCIDSTSSETKESRSGTRVDENNPVSSGGRTQAMNVDPPVPTFGHVLGPEEVDASGCKDPSA
ncbi:hypothetical protein Bca52824_016183 [Brassica carinata]|uniref:Uncharacterized protein n=1 Tax=Brassica carinata TaxID=52824 RepID=A0A8X7W5X3_BRACI|nr:hypothetical protein Bca52824_016183 [Brassica carinata]